MPFINGRYHINPAMGQALEEARAAADALLASDDASHSARHDDFAADPTDSADNKGPIHHIEIEAAELEGLPGPRQGEPGRSVPSSTGPAAHGFIARIHRITPDSSLGTDSRLNATRPFPARPETHVFTDHRDLLDFLRNELTKHCSQS